jgi:alkylation response protein AidB-like acyl-CoA dehydrogenase
LHPDQKLDAVSETRIPGLQSIDSKRPRMVSLRVALPATGTTSTPAASRNRAPVDFQESEERQILRTAVASGAARFGHDYYVAQARAGGKAEELWTAMAAPGYLGVNIPAEYGGGGGGITELAIVCEELAAAGCPLLLLVVSPAICGTIIARYGTDSQRQTWLPRLAAGNLKMAFAITEPDAGSNSHRLSTTATRVPEGWCLRGTKHYISGCDEADAVLVVAQTPGAQGAAGLSLFIVDMDSPGVERTLIPVEIVAPEKQFTLFFEDVWLPEDRLLGEQGNGLRQVFSGLNPERITIAATAVGIGRYALEKAAAYARDRHVWGTPIGTHQGIAHPLAQAKITLDQAALMTQKAAWATDTPGVDTALAGETANMAKYAAGEAALFALDQAIQTLGGNGMSSAYGLADLWGMARLMRIAPVSREMILNYVAQHSLGLPKSY